MTKWKQAPTEITRRNVFTLVFGDTGTGRTTYALTAPGPIALLHSSEKLEGIVQAQASNKDIKMFDFGGSFTGDPQEISDQAVLVWEAFKEAYYDAFNWAKTIVIDTDTELWELIRLARFGGLKPSGGRVDANYGPVNAEWSALWKHSRSKNVNVISIGQTKPEYVGKSGMGQATGRMIRAGQKSMPFFADVIVLTGKNDDGEFTSEIKKAWYNAACEGVEFTDDMCDFATVMSTITDTDMSEWGG